ncbi:hypothetical protein [Rhodococcus maanshanensis]|uniref:Uncharacterized protein n=1 Tax=Rhodococcus maanshanensis TaxID=183556 RepID=A0A1H7PM68_9NOCA|nr:hypothetical protein [Rhodococcus maanshanensis]SEL36699.1 hypothetical protein SAMN05444583_10896 [Rhodococcus maanshanensis]
MSVDLRLIKERYDYKADEDGDVSYDDGLERPHLGPVMYGYGITKGGVLTVTINALTTNKKRISFTDTEYGPMAWASVFGTEQSEIDSMSDEDFMDHLETAQLRLEKRT